MKTLKNAVSRLLARSRAALGNIKPKAVAQALVLGGAGITAAGLALAYTPAGVMLGGIGLIVWALVIFDVG